MAPSPVTEIVDQVARPVTGVVNEVVPTPAPVVSATPMQSLLEAAWQWYVFAETVEDDGGSGR